MQLRVKLIGNRSTATGLKSNIREYISKGDIVPDVITTERYLANTGLRAREASKQLLWEGKNRTKRM